MSLARKDFDIAEEISNFTRGRCWRVGAVNGVSIDSRRKIGADSTRRSLLRIGCTHQLSVQGNGVLAGQYLNTDRTGRHEFHQTLKKRAPLVLSIEAFCLFAAQMQHLQSHNLEACFLKPGKDFADVVLAYSIRFNDGQRLFYSHARLQS